jgi:hypothetical protein
MDIDQLDREIICWADKYYISPYAVRKDTALMILVLHEMPKGMIEAHLREEYADHFAEIAEEN